MTNLKKAMAATVALAASATMLLAGCGSNNTGSNDTGTAGQPVNGGTVTIGQDTKYDDQFIPDMSSSLYTANVVNSAFDYLLSSDSKLQFHPWLAKSWSWSADKKTLSMTLADAKWSDGQPITSDDVLFTMDYLASKDYNTTLQGGDEYLVGSVVGANDIMSGKKTSFAQTGGFKKVDDKTFEIHFNTVDAAILYSGIGALQPIPKHVLQNTPIKDWGSSDFNKKPTVVSGPFIFSKVSGQDSVELTVNQNYWKGRAHLDKLVYKTVSPDVAPGLLANGQVDIVISGLKQQDAGKLKSIPNITVKPVAENGWNYIGMKMYHKEFQDVRVRQAFEYAINRQALVNGVYKGLATPDFSPLPQGNWAAATVSDGLNPYDYSVDKANQLLDQAGWTKGADGTRMDPVTKKPAVIPLDYSTGNPTTQAIVVAVQQDLAKVGIKVQLNTPMEFNAMIVKMKNDDPNMWLYTGAWSLGTDPDPRGLWDSKDPYNFERWVDTKNDQLVNATWGANAFDQNARKQAFVAWQKYVNEQVPLLFLVNRDVVFAYNNRLQIPAADWSAYGPSNYQDWWVTK